MKHMERYLAATSEKSRNNRDDVEDHSAADSHEAVHDHCHPDNNNNHRGDALSKNLNKFGLKSPTRNKNDNLGLTSHAVIHNRQSVSSFSNAGTEFGSAGDVSMYDEVTVMEEEVLEEEVIEEVMEEVIEEDDDDDDYAWSGSKNGSERSRLSQRFPARSFRKSTDASVASSVMYEEETVVTNAMDLSNARDDSSRMSMYDEVTVADQTVTETETEEVTVVDGNLDDYDEGAGEDSNNSDLDSDDGIPEEEAEENEENQGDGFTLAFKRNSASQARVSDITLDHSGWGHEMDGEFDDDEHHIPGQGEDGYCSKFKEGNFRSSLVSHAPLLSTTGTKKFPAKSSGLPSTNKFLPSNKFSGLPKTTSIKSSSIVPKKIAPKTPPRVSIMKQFANKPLPALTEVSARKERGEKKKKQPSQCFDGAGGTKGLFMFWERKSSANEEESTPPEEESKTAVADPAA